MNKIVMVAVAILQCVFLFAQTASLSTSEVELMRSPHLDMWPDCDPPTAIFHIKDEFSGHFDIEDESDDILYYCQLVNKYNNDSLYFDLQSEIVVTSESILDYTIYLRSQCGADISSIWTKIEIIDESPRSTSTACYSKFLHYYFKTTTNELFLSFMSPNGNSGYNTNNYVYENANNLNENIYIRVKWNTSDGEVIEEHFSNEVLSTFIDPSSENPYLYLFHAPEAATSVKEVAVGPGDVTNCNWDGLTEGCVLKTHLSCGYANTIENYINDNPNGFIDVSQFICGQETTDFDEICSYTSFLEAEIVDSDLLLSFGGVTQIEFQEVIDQTQITRIDVNITGISTTDEQSVTVPFWNENMTGFNIESWQDFVTGFGVYSSFVGSLFVYDQNGDLVSCNTFSEIPVTIDSDVCAILSLLNATAVDDSTVKFAFSDAENTNYLEDALNALGYTVAEAEVFLNSQLDYLNFTLAYSNGAGYTNSITYVDLKKGIDLGDFSVTMEVNSVNNFSGAVDIEYTDVEGNSQSCLLTPLSIYLEEEDQDVGFLPTLDCSNVPDDLSNMSSELRSEVLPGQVYNISGFPLLILSITAGNNSSGFSGEGLIPLPFEQKQLFVSLINIQINVDGQVISGEARGKNGPGIITFPNFNLPPLYIGGEICIPPPTNSGLNADGIDPATGLTGYGFDPQTGKHHITNTEFDPNGYNIDGKHSTTGEIWNDEGCTRDGVLYVENPDTGEMEDSGEGCDPSGGAADPQALTDFKNTLNPILSDSLRAVYDRYRAILNEEAQVKGQQCETLRQILTDSQQSINSPLAYGDNNALIESTMVSKFSQEPRPLLLNGGRDVLQQNTEMRHIELYGCQNDLNDISGKLSNYESVETQLDSEIKSLVEVRLDALTSNELEALQDPVYLGNWLLSLIKEYVTETTGQLFSHFGLDDDSKGGTGLRKSMSYDAIASIGDVVVDDIESSVIDAMNFEYEQGFHEVMGYPRPIVTEALREYQLAMNTPLVESLLPLSIENSTSRFDISILISDVVFYPLSATMDVACVITDKENNNQKLAFGAENVLLPAGAIDSESTKLYLLNDVGIRLNNASRLWLEAGENATYVKWDCEGFAGLYVKGAIQFCREYILPLNDAGQVVADQDVLYELALDAYYPGLLDFAFSVSAPPFELASMPGYQWEIGEMGVDFTTEEIPGLNLVIPQNYNSVFFNKETQQLDDLWKGFYATNIKVKLPQNLFGNGTNTYYAELDNMIIDDTGLTAMIAVGSEPGLVSWDEGNANGWQMSVEELNILVLQNSIAGGGFGGRMGLAVLKDPVDYSATIYTDGVLFSVSPDTSASFSALGNIDVKLFKNSYIQGEFNEDGFFAKAHLHGTLMFGGENENEDLSVLNLPNLWFQELEFENYKNQTGGNSLRFSAGEWGVVSPNDGMGGGDSSQNNEEEKALMSGFGVSISELSVHSNSTNDGLFLRIGANVDLIKETLTAGGSFEIHGKLNEGEPIFAVQYDKFKVNELEVAGSIKGIMSLSGFVQWYDDSQAENRFGKGFRGGLSVELEKLFPGVGLTTAAQFGKVTLNELEHDYYFVDMVADLGGTLTIGPVTFNKLGGGMAKGMYPDYATMEPLPNFLSPSELRTKPLGTTLTGVQYVPDITSGYEFKLMTGFYCGKEDIFNGTGELVVRLTPTNSLSEIEIRAQGQFLSVPDALSYDAIVNVADGIPNALTAIDTSLIKVEDIPKPPTSATLSGFVSFRYNFVKKEFKGNVAAYLNMSGGIIKGAGTNGALVMVDIFFGKQDWWIWVGEPTAGKRAGMIVDLAVLEASLQAYFDIGTKIPPFPGLPARVRHLGQDLNINEANRASSFAFAFGASFDLGINASVAGTGVEIGVGAGFDMMLRKYEDVLCDTQNGPEEIGLDGWYAMGQAWAYIDGKIKIAGFNIAEAGIATVLQLQTPNPTWGLAALEVYYKVLWHEGSWKGDIEFGERCNFTSTDPDNEFGMNIIVAVDPESSQRDFGLDANVSANFILPLGDTIAEYAFFEGDPRPLSFELDMTETGLFNEEGRIDYEVIVDRDINSLVLKPIDFLKPGDSLWFTVNVDIYADYDYHSTQSKTVGFRTSKELEIIPKSNVKYSYPSDGMANFFTKQRADEVGYIQLHKGQSNIFYKDEVDSQGNVVDYGVKAKFTSEDGHSFYTELTYNPMTYLLQFKMPHAEFLPSTMYKLEVVRIVQDPVTELSSSDVGSRIESESFDTDKVLMELYFRTSEHSTLLDKIMTMVEGGLKNDNTDEGVRSVVADDETISVYIKTKHVGFGEVFDAFDLLSNGTGKPYVEMVSNANVYTPASNELDRTVFVTYDNTFWPIDHNFTEFEGYGYAGISRSVETVDWDYSVSKVKYENRDFQVREGDLKIGIIQLLTGPYGLKIYYNYPDGTHDVSEDLLLVNFIDNSTFIKEYGPSINMEPGRQAVVTDQIRQYIVETNQ